MLGRQFHTAHLPKISTKNCKLIEFKFLGPSYLSQNPDFATFHRTTYMTFAATHVCNKRTIAALVGCVDTSREYGMLFK